MCKEVERRSCAREVSWEKGLAMASAETEVNPTEQSSTLIITDRYGAWKMKVVSQSVCMHWSTCEHLAFITAEYAVYAAKLIETGLFQNMHYLKHLNPFQQATGP